MPLHNTNPGLVHCLKLWSIGIHSPQGMGHHAPTVIQKEKEEKNQNKTPKRE